MKYPAALLMAVACLASCKNSSPVVDARYADSLVQQYRPAAASVNNLKEMAFWKTRIDPKLPGMVNESKYAGTLVTRFHQSGNMEDLREAEQVMKGIITLYNGKEASPYVSLTRYDILQHRFREADSLAKIAQAIGLMNYEKATLTFDVAFELGRYDIAETWLSKLKSGADYGYYFRKSKVDHLNGNIDSAVAEMLKAGDLAQSAPYLQGVAYSNAADLYMHEGELEKAAGLYKKCIGLNGDDFHSVTGLAWIATVHDKNFALANRLLQFVHTKNQLPDPLFKLYQLGQAKKDHAMELKYANDFVSRATLPEYGCMYTKYLLEMYTGVLDRKALAETLAKNELNNRATPQTYAWYAWALFCNGKKDAAYKVYEAQVSGKPLEALELYWMGKLMLGLKKGYNAQEFFKAASKNKYDLSPRLAADLESTDL